MREMRAADDERELRPSTARASLEKLVDDWLSTASLRNAVLGKHHCTNRLSSGDACNIGLWGGMAVAEDNLKRQRERVLPVKRAKQDQVSRTARRELIYNHLILTNDMVGDRNALRFLVGDRRVCICVFAQHW